MFLQIIAVSTYMTTTKINLLKKLTICWMKAFFLKFLFTLIRQWKICLQISSRRSTTTKNIFQLQRCFTALFARSVFSKHLRTRIKLPFQRLEELISVLSVTVKSKKINFVCLPLGKWYGSVSPFWSFRVTWTYRIWNRIIFNRCKSHPPWEWSWSIAVAGDQK